MSTAASAASKPALKLLSPEQVERYRRDGCVFPVCVLSESEARSIRAKLEIFEKRNGGPLNEVYRQKSHLLFPFLWELIHHPRILDAVEDVLGPDLLCWSTSFFTKEKHDPRYVAWHQDATYWGLSSPDVMTAWVALSPSTVEAGAMRVVPGSHHEQVAHKVTFHKDNMLTRGQEVMVEVDPTRAVNLVLKPGEMSLHHVRLVHGSEPNNSNDRRIGFAIRYIPTHVRQVIESGDSAVLVRGTDRYKNFDPEPRPIGEFDEAGLAAHRAVIERQAQILYASTKTKSFDDIVRS